MNKTKKQREITWDTLKWKDVVINSDGNELIVLAVVNDLVFISYNDDFEKHLNTYHKLELQKDGYTIKQATPVEKVKIIDGRKYQLVEE